MENNIELRDLYIEKIQKQINKLMNSINLLNNFNNVINQTGGTTKSDGSTKSNRPIKSDGSKKSEVELLYNQYNVNSTAIDFSNSLINEIEKTANTSKVALQTILNKLIEHINTLNEKLIKAPDNNEITKLQTEIENSQNYIKELTTKNKELTTINADSQERMKNITTNNADAIIKKDTEIATLTETLTNYNNTLNKLKEKLPKKTNKSMQDFNDYIDKLVTQLNVYKTFETKQLNNLGSSSTHNKDIVKNKFNKIFTKEFRTKIDTFVEDLKKMIITQPITINNFTFNLSHESKNQEEEDAIYNYVFGKKKQLEELINKDSNINTYKTIIEFMNQFKTMVDGDIMRVQNVRGQVLDDFKEFNNYFNIKNVSDLNLLKSTQTEQRK